MKKLMYFLFLFFIICGNVIAAERTMTLAWDANTDGTWQALIFYQRIGEDGVYDYTSPIKVLPQEYVDGASTPVQTDFYLTLTDGELNIFHFVVRGATNCYDEDEELKCDVESADSNEVEYIVDLSPLDEFTFTAVYNRVTKSIDFAWPVDDVRANNWKIYSSQVSGGPYTEIASVDRIDTIGSVSVSIDNLYPDGEKTIIYYTMVSFGNDGIFSPNTPEVSVELNRKPASGVINFRILLVE